MLWSEFIKKLKCQNRPVAFEIFGDNGRIKADPILTRVVYDNRKISASEAGLVFACVRGAHTDGHAYAPQAVAAGAVALICEHSLPLNVPQIVVPDARAFMGLASAILHDRPSDDMTMIGLTGTNGKTTTAYIVREILKTSGARAGMIGTIVYDDARSEIFADRTTPEGPDIQDLLAKMRANGAKYCVMEASSHGLHQGRLCGCAFDGVGFSNLTPEHLEYHSDMPAYFAAKRLLFSDYVKGDWVGAVNADDPYGRELLRDFRAHCVGFSTRQTEQSNFSAPCYRAYEIRADISGTDLRISCPDGAQLGMRSPLIGMHNVANILESVAICDALGIARDIIKKGVENCRRVPGRLERYNLSNGVMAFIDYAHSTDGMENILSTLSPLTRGRLTVLWGAGGDRTPVKRPLVGQIMAKYADRVVITNDNPRSESPDAIARDVERGVVSGGCKDYEIVLDRKEAIARALAGASTNDVVVIAGKGPERTMDFGTHKAPFSDNDTLTEWAQKHKIEVLP